MGGREPRGNVESRVEHRRQETTRSILAVAVALAVAGCGGRVVLDDGPGGGGDPGGGAAGPGGGATITTGSASGGSGGNGGDDGTCEGQSCENAGFLCGFCEDGALSCGKPGSPWGGWDTVYSPEDGDLFVVLPIAAPGAECSNNGGADFENPVITVGNEPGAASVELFNVGGITFDLSPLPPYAKIVAATAEIRQSNSAGNAFQPPLTEVVVEHVGYLEADFTPYDFCSSLANSATIGERVLSTDPSKGWRSVDVVEAVRYNRAACLDDLRLRVRFEPDLGSATEPKSWASYNTKPGSEQAPRLTVRYR